MLESMVVHPTLTRAEVSEIAIAIREGADAVMLFGESGNGKWIQNSRDQYMKERLDAINDEFMHYWHHTIKNCAHACPKGLNPAKQIESIKKLQRQ